MIHLSIIIRLKIPWKGRGTRDQIASIHWIIEKAKEFQKNIYLCFIDYVSVIRVQINKAVAGPDGILKDFQWNEYSWEILKCLWV